MAAKSSVTKITKHLHQRLSSPCLLKCRPLHTTKSLNDGDECSEKKKKNPCEGKVAIVTGGSMGIGKSMVYEMLKRGLKGVVIGSRNEKIGKKTEKQFRDEFGEDKIKFIQTDVSVCDQVKRLFDYAEKKWKRIDIVSNNAGILQDSKWQLEIAINCGGVTAGTLLGFEYMSVEKGGRGGTIINNASILGLQPLASTPVYVGTKHYVIGFTRSFGCRFHYDRTKVKVMAVCPGVTATRMITEAGEHSFEENKKKIVDELGSLPAQPVECVGEGLITMLETDKNGSIWVSEGQEFYRVKIPDRRKFERL